MSHGGLSTAKVWITGFSISAITIIMYAMFAKFNFYLRTVMKGLNAPQAVQNTLNNEYNWAFIIIAAGGIIIPILWTFFREKREREY